MKNVRKSKKDQIKALRVSIEKFGDWDGSKAKKIKGLRK